MEREGGNRGRERGEVERVSLLSFPLKFSISSQPGCQAATIKGTLTETENIKNNNNRENPDDHGLPAAAVMRLMGEKTQVGR